MDIMTTETIRSLIDEESAPCVSLYMPTHRSGREVRQDPIRLGNLVSQARYDLVATGVRPPQADALLEPLERLTVSDSFWQHQDAGLALFACPGRSEWYRLPSTVDEKSVVADAFHVKPLWPVMSRNNLFYVLALSRNLVRLLWADRFRVGEVDLPEDIPESLAEALWYDDPEKQLQHRAAGRVGAGRIVAAFHGHGVPEQREGPKLEVFLRAVDRGLADIIDRDRPLVLAGVDDITALFRRVSAHPTIVDDVISGNPDEIAAHDLHRGAVDIMRPLLDASIHQDAEVFLSSGRGLQVSGAGEALSAALTGRVSVLFLPVDREIWGRADPAGSEVVIHPERLPGDRDLLDLMGIAAWTAGGRVHVVDADDVPGDGPVAAILRF